VSSAIAPDAIEAAPHGLRVRWPDGEVTVAAATLRAACRCAGCVAARRLGTLPIDIDGIRLTGVAPVGRYAVVLSFSDGHERGIYPWDMLREIGLDGVIAHCSVV